MKAYIIYTALALLLFACQNKTKLTGFWALHSMQINDSAGQLKDWKTGTKGYLLYDNKGHMALHLSIHNYDSFPLAFPNFTDSIPLKALKHLTNNYNYMGFYTLKNEVVSHQKISHSNPKEWGTVAERKFWFSGDTLIMTPVEQSNANLVLKWLRKGK